MTRHPKERSSKGQGNDRPARLADFLPYQLSIASNAVSERIAAAYRSRFGLKVPEWRVMAVLGDADRGQDGATQRDLSALTLMDKVAVNRACKVLEERGLAERRPHARDGRSHHLALTEAGRALHDEIMPLAAQLEARLLEGFEESELVLMRNLLARLRDRAGEMEG